MGRTKKRVYEVCEECGEKTPYLNKDGLCIECEAKKEEGE